MPVMTATTPTETTEPELSIEDFIFDPRPNYPFFITAKRYKLPDTMSSYSEKWLDNGITLILTHCVGGHKEQWEPTLEHLLSLLSENGGVKIREAWSIDWPNHGDAAILNEKTLQWGYDHVCTYSN